MSIHVALQHITHYRYDRLVHLSPQLVRLRPAPHCRTSVVSYSQRIVPAAHFVNWHQDPHSNYVARVVFPDPVKEFRIEVDLVAEMAVHNPFDFFLEPDAETFPFFYEESQRRDLMPFLRREPETPHFAERLARVSRRPRRTIDALVDINQSLSRDIKYVIRLDPGVQSKEETLELGTGSCRDTTWVLVQMLRHLGLAARFVSGYLIQLTADVKPLEGPAGPERDFTDLHAWCEVYLPGAGWIGLDPTSGLFASEGHVPLACTPEPASAAPVSGAVDECETAFEHTMAVRRILESPRVTKPYTEAQWSGIVSLGDRVDADLVSNDVRLTMGGEPTFVSATDRDGDEWNMAALGPTKRLRAADLLYRLKARFTKGAFVHFGQGKWYPGEPLPRWALGCYWRTDGDPVWTDPALFADESHPDALGPDDAERFLAGLAARLGVTSQHIQPGYEDVWYYLWRERKLPTNVDPFDARLDDEMERDRLRRVFSQGLERVVGYALPLEAAADSTVEWRTGVWYFRGERMYLVPGDSPMGLRLPLDSLPWAAEGDIPHAYERDPFAPREPLPATTSPPTRSTPRLQSVTSRLAAAPVDRAAADSAPVRGDSAAGIVRSAICAETRGGIL